MYLISQLALVKQYCFINSHTLVATWTGAAGNNDKWISKSITGCTVGEPVILGFKTTYSDSGGNPVRAPYRVTDGCNYARTPGNGYGLGTYSADKGGAACAMTVLIPTKTTISFQFWDFEADEYIYIYR